MALDTRIPLGVQQVDIASPLANLIQTRQVSQDRAAAAQDREREIARQTTQDQQRNTEFNQNSQLNAAKIEEFRSNKATQQYMQDTLTVKNLLESNNPQDAALVVQGMQERFKGTDYANGLDVDYQNIVNGNLEPVLSGINSELQVFQQMGKMAAPAGRQVQKVAPGETLVDEATGQSIFQAPERPQRDTARDQEIRSAEGQLISMGIPPDRARIEAENVVNGRVRFDVTEQGRVLKINAITGATEEIPISSGSIDQTGAPASAQSSGNANDFSLFGLSEEISGVTPTTKAAAAKVAAMFGFEAFPETVTNRQIAEGAMQGLVRALSINDQYPVREIERIRNDMAKISPRLLSGGPEVRAQMKGLHTLLTSELETARRDSSNPEMPTSIRAGAARAANDIKNFLGVMGYVDASTLRSPDDVASAPIQSLVEFIRSTDDATLNALPDDVEQAIFERVSSGRAE